MRTSGKGTFTFADYTEATYGEADGGAKVITTTATNTYTGVLDGEGKQAYLGVFRPDGTGVWVGLELVTGQVGGQAGSFVLRQQGTFDAKGVEGRWEVVPGAGGGDLTVLRGDGGFTWGMNEPSAAYTLDVELP